MIVTKDLNMVSVLCPIPKMKKAEDWLGQWRERNLDKIRDSLVAKCS